VRNEDTATIGVKPVIQLPTFLEYPTGTTAPKMSITTTEENAAGKSMPVAITATNTNGVIQTKQKQNGAIVATQYKTTGYKITKIQF